MPRYQQRQQQMKQKRQDFCSFCKNIGKIPFGHSIKNCQELKTIQCQNCGKNGHTIKYCPFIEKCQFCERVGHSQEKCFYNPSNNIPKCNGCGKFGHKYIDCYFTSQIDRENYLKQIQEKKEQEEQKQKKYNEEIQKFKEKGITIDVEYLHLCKKQFEENPNYKPWIIFCDSEDEEEDDVYRTELTKKEQYKLNEIKFQITLL